MLHSFYNRGIINRSFLWFLASFLIVFFLFQSFFTMLARNQEKIDVRQTSIIHATVKDRFRLFLNLPLNIGIIGADYFASGDLHKKDYGPFAKELLHLNKEIKGLSLIDTSGKIIRVFPPETNAGALGKISQNFPYLKNAFKNKAKYWLSPPFKLYQGCEGFALYVPIMKGDELKGWFVPVICTAIFLERFSNTEYFKSYDLIIKDEETHLPYFSTAMMPEAGIKIHESKMMLYDREMSFQSWRKDQDAIYKFPTYWSLLGALVISVLIFFIQQFYLQRKKARTQLEEISVLLRFTSKEAITNLIEVQSELSKFKTNENITYLTNLIEQIDLLQTMAHSGEGIEESDQDFLPLLQEQLDNFSDIIQKKELKIILKRTDFNQIKVSVNGWLIQNSVLASVLSHSIIHAEPGSNFEINYSHTDEKHFITFHAYKIKPENGEVSLKWDRRMEVARKVLHVYQGDLFMQSDLTEGMIIRITLPL